MSNITINSTDEPDTIEFEHLTNSFLTNEGFRPPDDTVYFNLMRFILSNLKVEFSFRNYNWVHNSFYIPSDDLILNRVHSITANAITLFSDDKQLSATSILQFLLNKFTHVNLARHEKRKPYYILDSKYDLNFRR